MKKRIIMEAVGAILIFIVGYFIGDATAINRVNKTINTKVSSQTSQKSTSQDNTEPKEEQKQKMYKLGEEGTSGNWSIKVLEAQEASTIQSGDGSDNKTTQQKFIIIKLQMTNISQAAVQYSDDEFALVNTKDKKQYEINGDDSLTANQVETIYRKNSNFFLGIDSLNPSTPKQTYLVFEVPKNFDLQNAVLVHMSNSKATGFHLK
ncbi:DUF4352 domain-containing protein [Clostridium coskatii]|uniref:Telomeric repeat-binding factor 2 n=1 Tax=Clostridium coskatii TaxID=1705578 RepID=A0A162LC71_9CLOT|nr:DUF4352 domain-containing protein [Clostridium coskatii]OAA94082.1 Telomeric repeat-binding factor 2 [Clostridium coskatii]OBR96644.1 telomeric repeat-binding factor 2 [Clostridium coskatii]